MDTIIGIDLGTSTTEAAVIKNGKPVMLLNFDQKVITPSIVGLDETGNIVVGEKAEGQLLIAPERTVMEVKRKMGSFSHISMGNRNYSPVEISAMILNYVRNFASESLGEDIKRAVISVPAYFDERKRQATVEAGKQAGFMVERILNEPTAAALSYGLEHLEEESNILIYDLGGGTFDVTLLEMFDGVLEVKASSGNNELGGKDFDHALETYLLQCFSAQCGTDIKLDAYAKARLHDEAQKCKKALSFEESYTIILPMLAQKEDVPYGLNATITREQFESMIENIIEKTHHPIEVILDDANLSPEDIDLILLVGGSTRIPLVQRDIEQFLGKKPEFAVNPDYAVAEGAAIQAGIISGEIDETRSIMMTDVNPFTLGVRSSDFERNDNMSVIIPRNITIPVTKTKRFYTSHDGQTEVSIQVYQGESAYVGYNHLLGEFLLPGVPPARAGKEAIDVTFTYNQNGMLQVTAVIVSNQKDGSIEINMLEDNKANELDVSTWINQPLSSNYRTLIRRTEKWLKQHENLQVEELLYNLKRAILNNDDCIADTIEEQLRKLCNE